MDTKKTKVQEDKPRDVDEQDGKSECSIAPPPAYEENTYLPVNPGFCELAWRERRANRIVGGGLLSSQYTQPCAECGLMCGDHLPRAYKVDWSTWVDPSINFRWESHIATQVKEHRELLGCWICWEYDQKWVVPMLPDEWYAHMRGHFKEEGYQACKNGLGVMQRRRNCPVRSCPKIHS